MQMRVDRQKIFLSPSACQEYANISLFSQIRQRPGGPRIRCEKHLGRATVHERQAGFISIWTSPDAKVET